MYSGREFQMRAADGTKYLLWLTRLERCIWTAKSAHKPPHLEIFSSQAPNFGNYPLTSPLFKGKCQFASPTLRKYWPHTPTWKKKKLSAPPGPVYSVHLTISQFVLLNVVLVFKLQHHCGWLVFWCGSWYNGLALGRTQLNLHPTVSKHQSGS